MSARHTILSLAILMAFAANATAAEPSWTFGADAPPSEAPLRSTRAWQITFAVDDASIEVPPVQRLMQAAQDVRFEVADQRPPAAVTVSDGYALRAKIHKIASFATLPIFGAQYLLGSQLDEGTASEAVRATHAAIATTMVGLFGVNTVTGVWNLWEGRHDPTKRGLRMLHGLLMLGADGGFVATGLLAPTNDGGGNRSLHKNVAITSIAVATAGYLIMLFGN
jgi:hypothetical protein